MNKRFVLLTHISPIYLATPEEEAAAKEAADAKAKAELDAKNKGKTYEDAKAEFDKMTATQRYAYKKELEKEVTEKLKLAEDKRLTQEERDTHQKRAEELQAQYSTEKELSAQREKKLQESSKKQVDELGNQVALYKGKYANALIDTELTREAASADELVPGQLQKYLKQDTVLIDEVDDAGKLTGEQVVRVNFLDADKDGKPVKMVLSVKDTLKRMKELPEKFGNFFKGAGVSGLGSGNGKGGAGSGAMPKDTSAYIAQRNAGRNKK